jgi:hypothetical protein
MEEKELIDGLRGLTLTEPRLGFDPDELASRTAKKQRTNRQLLATAAGTLVVVGMAVGTLLYVEAGESLPLIPGGATTTTRTGPPTTMINRNKPDMTKQVARIRAHLQQTLPTMLPDAQDLRIEPVEQAYDRDYVMAVVEYRDADGPAGFNISILGPNTAAEGVLPFKDKCTCDPPITRPDGSKVYLEKNTPDLSSHQPVNRDAAHYRIDGTMVSVYHSTSYNTRQAQRAGLKDANGQGIPGSRTKFPLSESQLIALVTDMALNVN